MRSNIGKFHCEFTRTGASVSAPLSLEKKISRFDLCIQRRPFGSGKACSLVLVNVIAFFDSQWFSVGEVIYWDFIFHCNEAVFFHLEWLMLEKPNCGLLLFILVKHCFCNHNGSSLETSDMGFSCFH